MNLVNLLTLCLICVAGATKQNTVPAQAPSFGTWTITLASASLDGYKRPVFLVNSFFQPLLEVFQGQRVEITVVNNIPTDYPVVSDGVTIHWHGLNMMNASSWYDGTAYIAQCPIYSGNKFTYSFVVDDSPGTYFWHAHDGTLNADGLSGPLIIRPAEGSNPEVPPPPHDDERILFVRDWYHTENGALGMPLNRPFEASMVNGNTGSFTWVGNPQSILFNGKGCYEDCTVGTNSTTCSVTAADGCNRTEVVVEPSKTYLLRLINGASLVMMTVCIEDHPMTLVAADAVPIEPITVDCVDINVGQRYDALITTDQTPGQYWVTALPQFRAGSPNGYAVLRYSGRPGQVPSSPVMQPGSVKPWSFDRYSRIQINNELLNAKVPADSAYTTSAMPVPDPTVRIYLNLSQPILSQTGQIRWALNNIANTLSPPCEPLQALVQANPGWIDNHTVSASTSPNSSTLSGALGVETGTGGAQNSSPSAIQVWTSLPDQPETETFPVVGTHVVKIALGEVVEVVLQNNPASSFNSAGEPRLTQEEHPFHLHGQHFWHLGVVSGKYPGPEAASSQLNTKNPPFRDTATMLPNSYLVFRFKAENPGTWILHCHILWHQFMGQLMTFVVSPDKLAPPPEGMPKCNQECTYNAAPWTVSYVNETYGNSGYDLPSPAG